MDRYVRNGTGDYFPSIYRNQYKFFHPTPVFPLVASEWPYNLPSCQGKSHSVCRHLKNVHDSTVTWTKIEDRQRGELQSELSRVHTHSIKKMLPWRGSTECLHKCACSSHYTGREMNYGDAYILGTEKADKFKNLVNSSNILSAHASRTNTWNGMKYTPRDWNHNTNQLCTGVNSVHNTVTMLEQETKKCIDETGKDQLRCSVDTLEDISTRVNEVGKWTDKLKNELKYNIAQFHELSELKVRLEDMLKSIEKPLEISKENQHSRNVRQGVELVRDSVEEALLHETEVFLQRHELLLKEIDKVNEQLTRLRSVRQEIEVDIHKKEEAKDADECAKLLTQLSKEIGPITDIPHQKFVHHTSPTGWLQHTQNIIQKSQDERNLSQMMSVDISKEMLAAANVCFGVWYTTNSAIKNRISEICSAKKQIEHHIHKLDEDSSSLRSHIADVKNAIDAKTPLLQLAQNRIEKRQERPGVELCRDKAAISLLKELHVLRNAIDLLTTKQTELEKTLEHILKTKSTLERDLKLKNIALFVDKDKCLSLRQCYPISTFQGARTARSVPAFMENKRRETFKVASSLHF